jgi:glycosyltransferase involved in cell wall biosynthesis
MARDPSHIVMVGTDPRTRGGISAVVEAWRAAGLFERWPIEYLVSHRDGTGREKALAAARGLGALMLAVARHPRAVLHVHSASRASFWRKACYMAVALGLGWPVVFHLHGGGFARFHDRECGWIRRRIVRFFLDRATVIVAVSERWAAWLHGATSNPRIACIPNPVALPPVAGMVREPGLVAFVGRCEEAKGVFDLLEAGAGLAKAFPRLRIECAGEGDFARLGRRAAALGIGERWTMRGWIGEPARNALLARASIFVFPSHGEGMPLALLEAMAAGCPVVASAVGGIPDLVRHGVNGLLVPAENPAALAAALARLLRDPAYAARLGRAARSTIATRYTTERCVERIEQIYAGLGVRRGAARERLAVRRLQESS